MFKFLFGGKKSPESMVPETDRERFKRLTTDLNALIDTLAVKPRITVDPATGRVELEEPEQFPDEALALPAPEAEADAAPEADAKRDVAQKISEGDAVAATPKAPVPNPPKANPPKPRLPASG